MVQILLESFNSLGRTAQIRAAAAHTLQDATLVDWDDLDYQLAAASEELMKAHARAEQLTEEKTLLERRWARIQASTHVDRPHPEELLASELAGTAATAQCKEQLIDSKGSHLCDFGSVLSPPPPPSLADATPEVLKHAKDGGHELGRSKKNHSNQSDGSATKTCVPVAKTTTFSEKSYPSKTVLMTVPTSCDSRPSQQGWYGSHHDACHASPAYRVSGKVLLQST